MQNTIKKEELLVELKTALADVFVGKVVEDNGKITLQFLNGQNFSISVEEV